MQTKNTHQKKLLKEDRKLCSTHTYVVVDQSASMKNSDVSGFRSRSHAAHGLLALEFIAHQLTERPQGDNLMEAVTLINMKDEGTIILDREPLDWLLFNKFLTLQRTARPRSHGSYSQTLKLVNELIQAERETLLKEIEPEDLPVFMVIFISDGRPSDATLKQGDGAEIEIKKLAGTGGNLIFEAMGLSDQEQEFVALKKLVKLAAECGVNASFTHTGLSTALMSTTMSSYSSTLTTTRTHLLTKRDEAPKKEKTIQVVPLREREKLVFYGRIKREKYEHRLRHSNYPFSQADFLHPQCAGIEIDKQPFGKGAERLVYRFSEIDSMGKRVGPIMVAKESIFIQSGDETEFHFHKKFMISQNKAHHYSFAFNEAVARSPSLQTVMGIARVPKIIFLSCTVYRYFQRNEPSWLLVEKYMGGMFRKYNDNNGEVRYRSKKTIDVKAGEILLDDFTQAYSHFSYVYSGHRRLVCDLQGVLNQEGRCPRYEFTDPAINSLRPGTFGKTDLGPTGIRNFVRSHHCNKVCEGLKLEPLSYRLSHPSFS
eukprot:GHVN01003923.1.p1 GENE.GHVN01003923.1~~GHVN01003923.1.p1  ORF type:complete len:541 (+),score=72.24 GHVN01003923.1:546-2168(+)